MSQVAEACNARGVPHPDIVTESGRALVAHHSVLVFNVLATNEILAGPDPRRRWRQDEHPVIQQLWETYAGVSRKNFQEAYHDALQIKEEAITAFNLGVLDLKARARVEELFWATCEKILKIVRELPYVPGRARGPREAAQRHLLLQLLALPVDARPLGGAPALPHHPHPPAEPARPRAARCSPTSPATATARSTSSSTCAT